MNKTLQNEKSMPQVFYAKHMKAGVANYPENKEVIYISNDTIADMAKSFEGKPVYVHHQEVDLENQVPDNRHHSQRYESDKRRKPHVMQAVAVQEHIEELDTGIKANATEEKREAKLAEHQVRAARHKEVQRTDFALTAQKDGDNQRAAGETQLERGRHPWECNGDTTSDYSQEDAQERGQYLGMVQRGQGIAQFLRRGLDAFGRADNHELVRKLDAQIQAPCKLETGARHTAHVDAVAFRKRQGTDGAPKNLLVRHEDGLDLDGGALRSLLRNRSLETLADNLFHGANRLGHPYDMQLVALLNDRLAIRRENFIATQKARHHNTARHQIRNFFQRNSIQILVVNHKATGLYFLGRRGNFGGIAFGRLVRILPKDNAYQDHHQNDADNAERISNRIADSRQGRIDARRRKSRIRRTEGRRIRDRTAQHPD